jgi:hypothetical protein
MAGACPGCERRQPGRAWFSLRMRTAFMREWREPLMT